MGTWSHGNFDDDTSADHLSILTSQLVKEVEDAMADPADLEPDEYWGCAVPCNLELLTLIARQGWVGVAFPAADIAKAWKQTYLRVWDDNIDGLEPKPEYKRLRREVLVKTFDNLIEEAVRREAD